MRNGGGGRACERRRSGGLAVDLGALERAVRANFCVFEKSLLKLIWIIGKYKYCGGLIVHSFKSKNTFEGPWGGLQTKEFQKSLAKNLKP